MTEQMELFKVEVEQGDMTIKQLDALVERLALARTKHDNQKDIIKKYKADVDAAESLVMDALEKLDKKSYKCEGIGTITRVDKLSVTVPKTPEKKQAMFNWIKSKLGIESYLAYMTINSQALNKLYKEQTEEYGARGEVLEMDGVDLPTTRTILSFRRN